MKQLYKQNIAYLFKKEAVKLSETDETPLTAEEGTPFYCNIEEATKTYGSPQSNMIKQDDGFLIKTTTQLDFQIADVIAFTSTPRNDVEQNDYNRIVSVNSKPYMQKGNKHRTIKYYEYWITVS